MHLPSFIVRCRIFLQALHHLFICYFNLFISFFRSNDKLQDIQQFPCIATGITQHGVRLGQHDIHILQYDIFGNRLIQQGQQISFLQWFQNIYLAAGKQRTDDLERGILCRGSDQGYHTCLYSIEQGILLRLAKAMYFVNKQDRWNGIEKAIAFCLFYHFPHIFHSWTDCAQCVERSFQLIRNNLRQRSLSYSRRSPQYKRGDTTRINHLSKDSPRTNQVFLPDIIVQRFRT